MCVFKGGCIYASVLQGGRGHACMCRFCRGACMHVCVLQGGMHACMCFACMCVLQEGMHACVCFAGGHACMCV